MSDNTTDDARRSERALATGEVSYRRLVTHAHRPTSARVRDSRLGDPWVCICSCAWYVISRDPDRLQSYFDEHLVATTREIESAADLLVLEQGDDRWHERLP
jgi:hypothetical protein